MKTKEMVTMIALATLLIALMQIHSVSACSCMPAHPQTSYCKSDYVILARIIRKSNQRINENDVYKIEIKRAFKMTSKTQELLRDGRLNTPSVDSLCGGLNLKVGKLYLIAANTAHIGICNYVREYSQMTTVERRGFAGGYKKGCPCEVTPMFYMEGFHQAIGTCSWKPFAKCETDFGACVPARRLNADNKPVKCHWRNSQAYATCRNELLLSDRNKLETFQR